MGALPWRPPRTYALGVGARGGRSSNTHLSSKSGLRSTGRPAVIKIRRHTVPGPLENRRPDGRYTRGRFARRDGKWSPCGDAQLANARPVWPAASRCASAGAVTTPRTPKAEPASGMSRSRSERAARSRRLRPRRTSRRNAGSAQRRTPPYRPSALPARWVSRRRPTPRRWRLSPGRPRPRCRPGEQAAAARRRDGGDCPPDASAEWPPSTTSLGPQRAKTSVPPYFTLL